MKSLKEELADKYPINCFDKVIEEAGEVLQAIGKYKRFGPNNFNPHEGPYALTNYDKLNAELDDLIEACYSLKRHL